MWVSSKVSQCKHGYVDNKYLNGQSQYIYIYIYGYVDNKKWETWKEIKRKD